VQTGQISTGTLTAEPRTGELVTKRSIVSLTCLAIIMILPVWFGVPDWPHLLSIEYVEQYASKLDGQIIAVEYNGDIKIVIYQTLLSCIPDSCDCNERWGTIEVENIVVSECHGDQCFMKCQPLDPRTFGGWDSLRLVGTLEVEYWNEQATSIKLADIDIEASQQLVDGVWRPIQLETGVFTVPADIEQW
jgi:hypothetical protein